MKSINDEAPAILLELTGMASPEEMPLVQPLRPESAPTAVLPDQVLRVTPTSGSEYILHVEFELDFKIEELGGIARQGGSLAFQYRIPARTVLFLLARGRAPSVLPEIAEDRVGETRLLHPFRTVRAWELDPAPVLRANRHRILPWVTLLRSRDEQVARAGELLAQSGDEEAIVRFLTLGSLRYDRKRLEGMLGGLKMGLTEAIVKGSFFFKEAREEARLEGHAEGRAEGLAEGKAEGLAEGQVGGVRSVLRDLLESHYPGIPRLQDLDAIQDEPTLRALIEQTFSSPSRPDLERAIRDAISQSVRRPSA